MIIRSSVLDSAFDVVVTGAINIDEPFGKTSVLAFSERLLVNSAGDWGPSKPTAVPDFIVEMRRRGHQESLIRKVVYENPLEFFGQSPNFDFTPPDIAEAATL